MTQRNAALYQSSVSLFAGISHPRPILTLRRPDAGGVPTHRPGQKNLREDIEKLRRIIGEMRCSAELRLSRHQARLARERAYSHLLYAFVEANQQRFGVRQMCRVLGISKSGFYAWRKRAPSARARQDAQLVPLIRDAYLRSGETFGAPRIHEVLQQSGVRIARKRVARLMREAGLRGMARRPLRIESALRRLQDRSHEASA